MEASPRISGNSAAARARRSASGGVSYTTVPNGSGRPCSAMYASAVRMISREFAWHSPLVAPHAVMPWPPRITPMARGFSFLIAAMSRPSWKPGRRQGTHTTRSPKIRRVSSGPSAAVAIAMPESGCRWSTCLASTRPCIAVSIEGAAPPLPCRQKSNAATISSSRSTPGYTSARARSRSSRSTASPDAVRVPRSPPEPFTHISSTSPPVTGSAATPLAEALPPA